MIHFQVLDARLKFQTKSQQLSTPYLRVNRSPVISLRYLTLHTSDTLCSDVLLLSNFKCESVTWSTFDTYKNNSSTESFDTAIESTIMIFARFRCCLTSREPVRAQDLRYEHDRIFESKTQSTQSTPLEQSYHLPPGIPYNSRRPHKHALTLIKNPPEGPAPLRSSAAQAGHTKPDRTESTSNFSAKRLVAPTFRWRMRQPRQLATLGPVLEP